MNDTTPEARPPETGPGGESHDKSVTWLTWFGVASFVYLLLVGVGVIGDGFKLVSGGSEGAAKIFAFAANPIAGVILGTLATALVQSSSTVTAVVVGLVAGGVPVQIAVPIIMGANMGTTITNTIVSLGNLGNKGRFNKAFQAATVHDFFNLFSIVIILPIELLFHPLQRMAEAMSVWFVGGGDASIKDINVLGAMTKPAVKTIVTQLDGLSPAVGGSLLIVAGVTLVMLSVIYLGKMLRAVMVGKARNIVNKAIGGGTATGIASGTVITVLVQSSSTTTSLIVPLAGSGVLTTKQVFPFTMGANIGTCITALLAATAISGGNEVFALQIALVHLLYNVLGVFVFAVVPWVKDWPIHAAEWLGNKTEENRLWAFGYIFSVFFVLPGAVFTGEVLFIEPDEQIQRTLDEQGSVEEVEEEELTIE
ncbi:MAG: Na/Pi symporter [Woeseiaceae bacterium]|nr:Na/Pi symporter [Woeseiaceae bacterium]